MSLAQSITGIAGSVLDKFIEDKDLKRKLEHELNMQLHNANLAQIEVNKEQAKSASLFVSGSRPAIMWICAISLFWEFFLKQLVIWGIALAGADIIVPDIQTEGLMTLTLSLLGLGGMRSLEKTKKVARNTMQDQ
jgi:hypothetical protein